MRDATPRQMAPPAEYTPNATSKWGDAGGTSFSRLCGCVMLTTNERAQSWMERARAKVKHRATAAAAATAGVVTEVKHGSSIDVAYHLQGDAALNTVDAFAKRQQVRKHPHVSAELERWWNAALGLARVRNPSTAALCFEDYLHIYHLLFIELLGDDYDEALACESAAEDWASDCGGSETMDEKHFYDAIFEVALWR